MSVVWLKSQVPVTDRTVAVFEKLLAVARAGKIEGSAVVWRTSDGHEHSDFTGIFEDNPEKGLSIAMRLSWKLTRKMDEPLP